MANVVCLLCSRRVKLEITDYEFVALTLGLSTFSAHLLPASSLLPPSEQQQPHQPVTEYLTKVNVTQEASVGTDRLRDTLSCDTRVSSYHPTIQKESKRKPQKISNNAQYMLLFFPRPHTLTTRRETISCRMTSLLAQGN